MKRKLIIILSILVILLVPAGTAFAQEITPPPVCEGDAAAGTVVFYDEETGVITVEDEEGNQCTVTLTEDYDHPINSLLAAYFNEINAEDFVGALGSLEVCAVYDIDTDTWSTVEVAEGESCEGTEVTVNTANEDGTFTATDENGDEIILTFDDEEATGELADALAAVLVDWSLTEDGSVGDVGDDIAAYHDDGIGYGVLVKFYAIAGESAAACEAEGEEAGAEEPCGVSGDELVTMFEDGTGIGKLFQEYGKPAMLGVGHIKQALSDGNGDNAGEACKSGGGHDLGIHTGHLDCVVESSTSSTSSTGNPGKSGDKGNKGGDDD